MYSLKELRKTYHTGEIDVHALQSVSLDFKAGEFVVLLGASGSGKSTLLNLMGGLDQASEGSLVFDGFDLTHANDSALNEFRREKVGFVFQFYNLIPSLTAEENVELISDLVEQRMPSIEALRLVGMEHRRHHFPAQLSGGEQQRVAIARAIAKYPKLLLCDEPTGALDIETGITVLNAIDHINRTFGTLTVVITHNACIAHMADRVVHLKNGRVVKVVENKERVKAEELSW
jgi:putative ABC transport system ATP-binding protein